MTTSAASRSLVGAMNSSRCGADFLFALKHHLDVHRQRPFCQVRLDRLEVQEDLPLVVDRAAGEKLPVPHRRLERRRLPLLQRIHRLHVVVPVDEERRRAFGAAPLAVDDGIPGVSTT